MPFPHGGKLINKVLSEEEKQKILRQNLEVLILDQDKISEVKNIAFGVYSPLKGFLNEEDFKNVALNMRLANGIVWPIPIVLDLNENDYQRLKNKKSIILSDANKKPIALLDKIEFFSNDKEFFAKHVFGTLDKNHPGVDEVYQMGDYLAGGEIGLIDAGENIFPEYNFTPEETRKIFQENGWEKIVAFQTRNVPHRAHEFLQKSALKEADGLFIQPVIGKKKIGDFRDDIIIKSYEIVIKKYFPEEKVHLGILPLKMRYAGPREAVLHALIRKNFGCTHILIGRDHAGVGNYYGSYDAQKIFDNFEGELDITPIKCENVVYCNTCGDLVYENSCNHVEAKESLSGTKMREMIKEKITLPPKFIRPEISDLLINSINPFVDENKE